MTKAEKQHLDKVQRLGCIVCRTLGYRDSPAEIHHLREGNGKGERASHFEVLPLCPIHHRLGANGVAFHAGKRTWQENFGTESELLAKVEALLR